MFSQYFGHYLLNRSLLTHEELTKALDIEKSVHVKLGVIAVDKGLLTSAQVEEVHEKQKQVDKRFGEIAVELGYLTVAQVEELISHQKQSHLYLAQALVDLNLMNMEQFSAALHDYKKAYSLSDDQFENIRNGDVETLIDHILIHQDAEIKDKYSAYLSLFAKNMVRFIDNQIYLEVVDEKAIEQGQWVVYQKIAGDAPLFTAFNLPEDVLLHVASVYAEEDITQVDELAKDAVSEFLNLHNGIYLVNMSNWGTELTMSPQQIAPAAHISGDFLPVQVETTKGTFQLLLTTDVQSVTI